MKKFLLFLNVFLTVFICYSQTIVERGITTNTTWSKAQSPYIVTTSITLFDGINLIIEPGTTIKFKEGVKFRIDGTLIAEGTKNDSITFTSEDNKKWHGLDVIPTGSVVLKFVKAEHSNTFMHFRNESIGNGNSCLILNSTLKYNYIVITMDLPTEYTNTFVPQIEHCSFILNDTCIKNIAINVSNTNFISNKFGIANIYFNYLDNQDEEVVRDSRICNVTNCAFKNNKIGIIQDIYRYKVNILKNEISHNIIGMEIQGKNQPFQIDKIQRNKICANSSFNIRNETIGAELDLSSNCWCSLDSPQIGEKILDGHRDPRLTNVTFIPAIDCFSCTVSAGEDVTLCSESKVDLGTQPKNDFNYKWQPGMGLSDSNIANPTFAMVNNGEETFFLQYILTATSPTTGCTAIDTVDIQLIPLKIAPCRQKPKIHIYNVITPNGDNDNEVFYIENLLEYPDNEVYVYNRWGDKVYHSKGYKNDWTGQNLPDGKYYYVVHIREDQQEHKGELIINR